MQDILKVLFLNDKCCPKIKIWPRTLWYRKIRIYERSVLLMEWMYRSVFSWPWQQTEGELDTFYLTSIINTSSRKGKKLSL
jgi:hypothetical protein